MSDAHGRTFGSECTVWLDADARFCLGPAAFVCYAADGVSPIDLRCAPHRTPEAQPLPAAAVLASRSVYAKRPRAGKRPLW